LGSLAMDRQNLNEGATLKVREMLAMGIPVYSTHIDTALPPSFLFYRYDKKISINNIISFAKDQKSIRRSIVRDSSIRYISKKENMYNVMNLLYSMGLNNCKSSS